MPRQDFESDYYRRVDDPDLPDTLWIVFSHVDIPATKFSQTRVFANIAGDKVFLNCPDNSWYQAGVPGVADNIEELMVRLVDIAEGYDRVNLVGHSMGGYMALALGAELSHANFLATSPEPLLCLPGSRSLKNNVTPAPGWESLADRYFRRGPRKGSSLVIFGVADPMDACFMAREQVDHELYGTAKEVPFHHGVTEFLSSRKQYADLLSSVNAGTVADFAPTVLRPPFTYGSSQQYRLFYDCTNLYHREPESTQLSEHFDTHRGWLNPGWQILRSKYYRRNRRHDEAIEASRLAYEVSTAMGQAIEEHILALWYGGPKRHDELSDFIGRLPVRSRELQIVERAVSGIEERGFVAAPRRSMPVTTESREISQLSIERLIAEGRLVAALDDVVAARRSNVDAAWLDLAHARIEWLLGRVQPGVQYFRAGIGSKRATPGDFGTALLYACESRKWAMVAALFDGPATSIHDDAMFAAYCCRAAENLGEERDVLYFLNLLLQRGWLTDDLALALEASSRRLGQGALLAKRLAAACRTGRLAPSFVPVTLQIMNRAGLRRSASALERMFGEKKRQPKPSVAASRRVP